MCDLLWWRDYDLRLLIEIFAFPEQGDFATMELISSRISRDSRWRISVCKILNVISHTVI